MAVYFVTGKLGSGKSLCAVGRIRDYLRRGAPVATNLDIRLDRMFGTKSKRARLYRLPDKPGIQDLDAIGIGNATYDESRNGLLVLDECGTWFNSRQWADKERQSVIDWFLHARKKGWDILFLVQNIAIVDKQARLALAEHVVYCRRLDRMTIPFISTLSKIFTGTPITLPKMHVASVRYGDQPTSLIVDRWWYFGIDLYDCYDTKQAFSDFYPHKTFLQLPPWYTHGRYQIPLNWSRFMRMTKIHWKRFSRPVIGGAFFALGVAAAILFREAPPAPPVAPPVVSAVDTGPVEQGGSASPPPAAPPAPAAPATPVRDQYSRWVIAGYMRLRDAVAYKLRAPDGTVYTLDTVRALGVDVFPVDNCQVRIVSTTDANDWTAVYARDCNVEKPPVIAAQPTAKELAPAAEYVPPSRARFTVVSDGEYSARPWR